MCGKIWYLPFWMVEKKKELKFSSDSYMYCMLIAWFINKLLFFKIISIPFRKLKNKDKRVMRIICNLLLNDHFCKYFQIFLQIFHFVWYVMRVYGGGNLKFSYVLWFIISIVEVSRLLSLQNRIFPCWVVSSKEKAFKD